MSKAHVNGKFYKNFKPKVSHEQKQTKNESDAHAPKGAQPQTDKEHTRADAEKVSGSKSGKPFKKGKCGICHKKGHWAKDCYSAKKGQKSQISNVEVTDDTKSKTVSVEQYLLHVSAVNDSNCVDLFATKGESPLVTNNTLLTRICVENVAEMTFEIDTAASHSLLSRSIFDRLQRDLAVRGRFRCKLKSNKLA